MRIEVTIDGGSGAECDVAIDAPPGTTLARLRPLLRRWLAEGPTVAWNGRRMLTPDTVLGCGGVSVGDRISCVRTAGDDLPGGAVTYLHVVGGVAAGRRVPLAPGALTIGRDPCCGLRLADPDVSRRHARIEVSAGGLTLRDLGSTNGTTLDGTRLGPEPVALDVGALVRVGESFLAVAEAQCPPAVFRRSADGTRTVSRAAHARAAGQLPPIELPAPLGAHRPQPVQWIAAALPAAFGLALALIMHMPQFLLFALLSPAMMLGAAASDRVHGRRGRRRAAREHRDRLRDAQARVARGLLAEARARRAQHPDPAALRVIAQTPGTRLWERHRDDPQLLDVRLGLADAQSQLTVRDTGEARPAGTVTAVPAVADLACGPLGIAGPPGPALAAARGALCQLAVLASPADVGFALLLRTQASSEWRWARWLPHLGARVAVGPEQHRVLLAELLAELDRRAAATRPVGSGRWPGPALVVVIDAGANLAELGDLARLLHAGPAVGITAICVGEHEGHLPLACASVARVGGETGSRMRVRVPDGEHDVVADLVGAEWADAVARALAPLRDAAAAATQVLPERCALPDVLGLAETTADGVLARWRRADARPSTVLGQGSDGPFTVDLARDGPHALVAGTTGSGKSELLRSLVAGLALCHPPDDVTFVLVDYKGGAAFAACARLPHTAGLVTDLDSAATVRALQSLDCELRRRERLLAATGAKDIDDYHAAGAGRIARLVLVVDEFAALSEELPAFVTGLIGIAQRGRSLGVHLILATQRPGGVVSPEIRANSALRIALRVTDATESSDVIDGPQAAAIDARLPGRAWVRTGTSTVEIQTAHTGASRADTHRVAVEELDGWRRPTAAARADGDGDTELTRLVDAIGTAARRAGCATPRQPWLPPLAARLPADSLDGDDAPEAVPIARLDLPTQQQQPTLAVDLRLAPSLLFAGGARSGRSTALCSLAITAAGRLGPDDLHVHGIDCGGGGLTPITELRHCGTLARGDDFEPAARLLRRLDGELTRRRGALGELGFTAVDGARRAGHRMPLLLLLLDGWEQFLAAAEAHDGTQSVEALTTLLRDGPAAGVTIALAGDRSSLSPRLAALVATKLVLRLTDPADYALAGIAAQSVPATMPPGRGLRAGDGALLQLAHAGRSPDRDAQRDAARRVSAAAPAGRGSPAGRGTDGARPIRIRPLPARVALSELEPRPPHLTLGVAGDEAGPLRVDPFAGAARMLVAGPPRSGRSNVLLLLAAQALRRPQTRVVVAAPPRSPVRAFALAHGLPLLEPDSAASSLVPGATAPDETTPDETSTLLLVDDCERFADTPIEDAVCAAAARATGSLAIVAAGRNEDLAVSYRGMGAELRRSRCGLLLAPEQIDGELLGVRLGRVARTARPGRGLLVADPDWGLPDHAPLPVQIALHDAAGERRAPAGAAAAT